MNNKDLQFYFKILFKYLFFKFYYSRPVRYHQILSSYKILKHERRYHYRKWQDLKHQAQIIIQLKKEEINRKRNQKNGKHPGLTKKNSQQHQQRNQRLNSSQVIYGSKSLSGKQWSQINSRRTKSQITAHIGPNKKTRRDIK